MLTGLRVPVFLAETVNVMPSSKTTVLGIRLDHERRAWVEAEAARHGVTVRALFEYMIDEARYEEALDKAAQDPGAPEPLPAASDPAQGAVAQEFEDWWGSQREMAEPFEMSRTVPDSPATLCDELVNVAGIPGRLVRQALSIPGAVIKVAGGCVRRAARS